MASWLTIKLVRHAESLANVNELNPQEQGDYKTPLTAYGLEQAAEAGRAIGAPFLEQALVYHSPYLRVRQTVSEIFRVTGADDRVEGIYEDPRLREVDHGYADVLQQAALREKHGWFYYRYAGGESPADCYDRTSGFLESLMRQVERKKAARVLIVTHGTALRCFVMRFLRLSVDDFERMENPHNCDVVTIADRSDLPHATCHRGTWAVEGVRFTDLANAAATM